MKQYVNDKGRTCVLLVISNTTVEKMESMATFIDIPSGAAFTLPLEAFEAKFTKVVSGELAG